MEISTLLGSIGLCVGAIVAAAVIYFVVTAIKAKEPSERNARHLSSTVTSRTSAHGDSLLSWSVR